MKIAIIGATRGIGLELVKLALEDGHEVTTLVRTPSRMSISDNRLKIIKGDAQNFDSIKNVEEGQDVVCDCLEADSIFQKTTLFSTCAEHLSKALNPEQLLIAVTGLGAGDSKGHGGLIYDKFYLPVLLRRIYDDKDRQESIIKKNIQRWIIVRLGFLNNGPRTGRYRALTNLEGIRGGKISRADVADFILSQAKSPQFIGKTPLLIY